MKKLLLALFAAATAVTVTAQTWTAASVENTEGAVAAGITLVDNDNIAAKTYYATTISAETPAWEIGSETVGVKMNVRVNAWPSADAAYGTEKEGSTPVIITTKNAGDLTLYFRRQAKDGYVAGDGKDVRVFEGTNPLTATAFEKVESVSEDDAYAHCTETFSLEAGKEYTICAKGTTLGLMAFDYVVAGADPEPEPQTYQLVNCTGYPTAWGWNDGYIIDLGKKVEATLTVDGNHYVVSNWDGDGHVLDFTINEDKSVTLNNGTVDQWGYYDQYGMTGNYSSAGIYMPYLGTGYAYAGEEGAYIIVAASYYKDDYDQNGTWGELYLASGEYVTTVYEPSEEPEPEPETFLFSKTAYYVDGADWWGSAYAAYTDDEVQLGFPVEVDVYSQHVVLHNYLHSTDPAYDGWTDLEITYDANGYSTAFGGTAKSEYANYYYTGLHNMYYAYMKGTEATIWNDETSGYVYIYVYLYGDNGGQYTNYLITWDPETIAPYVEDPTAIKGIEAANGEAVMYNIFGQQTREAKGLVVKNGQKMIVK